MGSEAYGDFAWVYDGPLGRPFADATRPEIENTIRRYLGDRRGDALDLACGTGLSTRILSRLGFHPTGIDASLSMLAQARSRDRRFVAADIRSLPVTKRFALVTCFYDSLNHMLAPGDLEQAMREIARVLDEGGLFLFDVNQPGVYSAIWDSPEPFEHRDDSRTLEMRTTFDASTAIATASISGTFTTARGQFRFREVRRQRAWTCGEIEAAIHAAGLRVETRIDFDPFDQSRDSGIGIKWLFAARPRASDE